MKKFFSLFMAVMMILSFGIIAFADMGPPSILEYEAVISNPDGAKEIYGEKNFVIPYQSKVTVVDEVEVDGNMLVYVKYNDKYYTVNYTEISKINSKVGAEKGFKQDTTIEKVVSNPDGTVMRDGPAKTYDAVTTVPFGTVVKSNYTSGKYDYRWIYVSYGNYSGWIDVASPECANIEKDSRFNFIEIIDKGHYIYDRPEEGKKLAEVPVGTRLTFEYITDFDKAYVSYKDVKGWIDCRNSDNRFSTVVGADFGVYVLTACKLYESPTTDLSGEAIAEVPENTVLYASKYTDIYKDDSSYEWYYTEYGGQSGWVCYSYSDFISDIVVFSSASEADSIKEVPAYSYPDASQDPIFTVPKGERLTLIGNFGEDSFSFVKYKGKTGWVINNDEYFENEDYSDSRFCFSELMLGIKQEVKTTAEAEESTTAAVPVTTVSAEKPAAEETKVNKPVIIIAACVLAACVAAASAVIVLMIRNKKNKKKDNAEQ